MHRPFNQLMAGMANMTSAPVNDGASTYDSDLGAYVIVGILGALIWDIFSNLGEDYELIQRSSIGIPIIVYFSARITTLLCLVLMAIFLTAINMDCAALMHAVKWAFVFGLSLTTLLLLLRARAVYKNQKWMANFLSIMWLGVVAASLVQTRLDTLALRQEPSGRCMTAGGITPFIITSTIIPVANDIVIFCAITRKLVQNSHEELTLKKGLVVAILGHRLPSLSKALLRDGQAYFLTTIVVSISTIGMFCITPQTQGGYSALLAFINITVMHLMACKIYRKTRLGVGHPEMAVDLAPSLEPMEFGTRVDSPSAAHVDSHNLRLEEFPTHFAHWHDSAGTARGADLKRQKMGDNGKEEVDVVEGKIN